MVVRFSINSWHAEDWGRLGVKYGEKNAENVPTHPTPRHAPNLYVSDQSYPLLVVDVLAILGLAGALLPAAFSIACL